LEELVFIKHPSLRAFCKATGLSVGSIITREAKEKRIDKSGDVPTPLLLEEEHYELLSAVASEMWANNTEVLRSDLLDLV
jgi:hypothetical protein